MMTTSIDPTVVSPQDTDPAAPTAGILAALRSRLTNDEIEQLLAWSASQSSQRDSQHLIKYNVSSAFLGRSFYVSVFAGSEKRSRRRLNEEGKVRSFWVFMFELILVSAAITALVGGLIATLGLAVYAVMPDHGVGLFEGAAQIWRFLVE
jgi:hypothetical protein